MPIAFLPPLAFPLSPPSLSLSSPPKPSTCPFPKILLHHSPTSHLPPSTPSPQQSNHFQKTLNQIRRSPIVLCIRLSDPEIAFSAASAAIRGGLTTIEITLTTPSAISLISTLSSTFPHACIGAGTVLTSTDLIAAHSAGARFALSPITDLHIIQQANQLGILPVPGAATPTEIFEAHKAGAKIVKIFPVNLCGGMDFVKAMQGPLGHIPLLPTSGIDATSLPEFLSARNIFAVGASRQILLKEALDKKDWNAITNRASTWAAIAAEYTSQQQSPIPFV